MTILAIIDPPRPGSEFVAYYHGIASTVITLSSIALGGSISLMSFLFMKIRDVYDTEEYTKIIRQMRAFNPSLVSHAPLRRFFYLSWLTIIWAIFTLVAQAILSKSEEPAAAILCLLLFGTTVVFFVLETIAVLLNVLQMIRISEKRTSSKIAGGPT